MSDQNPAAGEQTEDQAFDITVAIPKVIEAVNDGTITAEDALQAEEARGTEARPTLVEQLKKLVQPVNNPKDPAPSSAPSAQLANQRSTDEEMEAKDYKKGTFVTTKKVQDNTYGLGSFFDPEQKKTFGKAPTEGYATPFVNALIRNEELREVS